MNRPVLMIGTGPTLNDFNVGPFIGLAYIIAVNDSYKVCPQADMIYACDYDWWSHHGANVSGLRGEKVTLRYDLSAPNNAWAREVEYLGRNGFSVSSTAVFSGHNSGFQALQLAASKSSRIFMAGFDMGATGNTHFFGDHPPSLTVGSDYKLFVEDFKGQLAAIRAAAHVSLVTTPSALDYVFETISPEDAIRELSQARNRNR